MRLRIGSRSKSIVFLLGAASPYAYLVANPSPKPATVSYGRDIAPIFKAHCISCHAGSSPSGGLDLSSKAGILKGGLSGKIVTSDVAHSVLLKRIDGSKGPQMPMGMPALIHEDQEKIKTWIAEGMQFDSAVPQKHWAYVPPVPPKIPSLKSSWIKNPIDAFILQKQKENHLSPSPEASKETLIRRATLDLTGLLPTPSEVQVFVADKSPDAYERVVDRLLKSPHYGERQARGWLDLARYADSDGYEKDLNRNAYMYRDWVINAFNRNEPYDQFTIDQIAGDLLPNATMDQKVATGFQRNTMFNREGGVDQEEAHFLVQLDRAEVTSTVWLGSTLNCARCHDHKYDPFTQKDYYGMVAYYNNTVILPRGPKDIGEEKWFEAELKVPSAMQMSEISRLSREVATDQANVKAASGDTEAHFEAWKGAAAQKVEWNPIHPSSAKSDRGETLSVGEDGTVTASGATPENDTFTVAYPAHSGSINAVRLQALPEATFAGHGPGRADNGNFVLTKIEVTAGGKTMPATYAKADFTQPEYEPLNSLIGSPNGWAINGKEGMEHEMIVDLDEPVPPGQPIQVTLAFTSPYRQHILGKFKLSVADHPDATTSLIPSDLRGSTAGDKLKAYWVANDRFSSKARIAMMQAQAKLDEVQNAVPSTLVMQEKPILKPLAEWVRHRGEFGSKTDFVESAPPAVLGSSAKGRSRLVLAKWLVSRDNPLTARVQVNRMWEQIFGRGIVETSEDFGTRGSRPTHPELLDYLACWFMNHGWDMKALYRMILTSATYRQSSDASVGLMAKDPQNLYLARGARFRMEAEMIHDVALDAGGLLSEKLGGPSVYPYQPDNIWDSPYSGQRWEPSKGGDRYRRGLYTFWKRTAPYPSYIALDATSRESCTVRRIRTNTPLQALALLNDKLMVQAAANLGKRMETGGKDLGAKLTTGFEICTSRKPKAAELTRLEQLEGLLEKRYSAKPADAAKLGGTPRDAAFTMVGNVLLNLDETITKG